MYLNAEHDTFKKAGRKAAIARHEEANENQFFNSCMMVLHYLI